MSDRPDMAWKPIFRTTSVLLMLTIPAAGTSQSGWARYSETVVAAQVNTPAAPGQGQKRSHHRRNVLIVAGTVLVGFLIFALAELRRS